MNTQLLKQISLISLLLLLTACTAARSKAREKSLREKNWDQIGAKVKSKVMHKLKK